MSTPWAVAVIAVWILVAAVAVGLVALARQVGLLHLRVRPLGPGSLPEGPPIGSVPTIPELVTMRARPAALLERERTAVVLFVSSTCGLCKPVLDGAARLRTVEDRLALTLAVDGDEEIGLAYLQKHGFEDGLLSADLAVLDSGQRPYAVALADDGLVLAAGAVNSLDQLEGLIDLARDRESRGVIDDLEDESSQTETEASVRATDAVGVAQD
jgi:methylamine dehydrogenase accessory protein MauD